MTSLSTIKSLARVGISLLALLATGATLRGQEEDRPVFRRDPFWPVGYEKEHKGIDMKLEALNMDLTPDGKPASADWNAARKLLNVGSVAWNRQSCMAMVNGRVVEVGDPVVVEARGLRYQWVVTKISRKDVLFENVSVTPIKKKMRVEK